MTVFGLVRSAVGNDESARSKYLGPTGKRSAGKLACSVWSGGKAVRPYLSLFEALLHCAPRRRLMRKPLGQSHITITNVRMCISVCKVVAHNQRIQTPSHSTPTYAFAPGNAFDRNAFERGQQQRPRS